MLNLINNKQYYYDYLINNNPKYTLNQKHIDKIITVLNQARHDMVKPMVAHICIYVVSEIDPTIITPRIKRVLPNNPMSFAYSIEKAYKLHIHLMLVIDCKDVDNPDQLFVDTVMPAISKLPNVQDCVINERTKNRSYYHALKNTVDFYDAVSRYSYFAKTNHKQYVPATIKKKFNTSHINNKKYFSLNGNSMLKLEEIKQKNKVNFIKDNTLTSHYKNFKLSTNAPTESQLRFYFNHLQINKAIGFYGLSFEYENDDTLHLSFDALCIARDYIGSDWVDVLYPHLLHQLKYIVSQYRSEHPLAIYAYVQQEDAHIDELFSVTINVACEALGVDYRRGN